MHANRWIIFLTFIFGLSFAINRLCKSLIQKQGGIVNLSSITLILLLAASDLFAQQQLSQSKAERLFAKGKELVDHANYGAAREVFTDFLNQAPANDPRRSEAQYYVAFSALNLNHADGEKLIDNFIEENPSTPKASTAYYDLAVFFYDEKSYAKAIQYFKKVDFPALTYSQQSQGHFAWGYSLFNQKQLDEALTQFNFVKNQNNAYSPAASYYAGFLGYSRGMYAEALTDLKRAESSPSYSSIVPFLIANVYYRQKKYDELIQYATGIKNRPDISNENEIAMLVAEAYYFKGDYKNAVKEYEQYFSDNAGKAQPALLFRAGHAYYSLEQSDKAIEYLKRSAASADSVSHYASYYLGILYLKKGEKPYALNSFDYARKSKDKKLAEEGTFQHAKVAFDEGKFDLAITEMEKFLRLFPASNHEVEVKELLVQGYVNGNNFNKAIEYIESLPRRNPATDKAYQKATYLKGAELFNKENYAEAVTYFKKSMEYPLDRNYEALAAFWCGEAYSIGRKYEEAADFYLRVAGLGSEVEQEILLKTRYGLGYAYYNSQVYDRAQYNFKEFVSRTNRGNPNHTDALIRLADCYYVAKSYEDALAYYMRANSIGSPDNDYILLQTGVISGVLRKYSDAQKQLTSLITSYPKSQYRDDALFQRAQFEIEQGHYDAAIEGLSLLIKEAASSPFMPYAYLRRAASYFNLQQNDRTINDYLHVVREYAAHPAAQQALLPLQEALNASGRSGEFEKVLADFKRANPDNKGLESLEYETAKNFYFNQQYQKAVASLNTFMVNYPQSARMQEARYYLAESHYRQREFDKALPLYKELSADMSFTQSAKVIGRVAEIDFRQGRYEQAVGSFKKLEKIASSKRDLFNAWSGLMESYYLLNQYDSVNTYANLILEKGNVNASAQNKASLYLGKAAMEKGDYETAKDEFLNTLNTARDEYGAEAKYLLGKIFYLTKDHKQCYETLIGLDDDFAAYEEWVGKAFLLLSDNFIAMGDVFQAKATLQSLVDGFPSESIRAEAKNKLQAIEKTQAQSEATTDTIESN